MLQVHLDARGNLADQPVVVVAGWVATDNIWNQFDPLWMSFLQRNTLKRFHATDDWARKRPFSRMSDADYASIHTEICGMLTQFRFMAIGAGVSVAAFNEWRNAARNFNHPDPYFFCLDQVLRQTIMGITEYPKDEGIEIICDVESRNAALGREIAAWREQRLRRSTVDSPHLAQPDRPVSFDYRSRLTARPSSCRCDCSWYFPADVQSTGGKARGKAPID